MSTGAAGVYVGAGRPRQSPALAPGGPRGARARRLRPARAAPRHAPSPMRKAPGHLLWDAEHTALHARLRRRSWLGLASSAAACSGVRAGSEQGAWGQRGRARRPPTRAGRGRARRRAS